MPRRMIAKLGHPVLLQRAAAIDDPMQPEIQALIRDMTETLVESGGVGLAAPQVFESLRLILALDIDRAREVDDPRLHVLINPRIRAVGDGIEFDIEGCLSIDEMIGIVPRHTKIRVQALDGRGNTLDFAAEGYLARIIQHEVDHLDGLLFPMRARDWRWLAQPGQRAHLNDVLDQVQAQPA